MGDLVIIFIFFNTFVRYLLVFKWVSKFPQNSREVWAIWEECVRYSGGLNKLRCAEKIRFGKRLNGNIRQRCTCLHNRTIAQCVIAHLHTCTIAQLNTCRIAQCRIAQCTCTIHPPNSCFWLVSGRTLTHFKQIWWHCNHTLTSSSSSSAG